MAPITQPSGICRLAHDTGLPMYVLRPEHDVKLTHPTSP
jgi:hypothetical protein